MAHYQYTLSKQNKSDTILFIFGHDNIEQQILESLLEEKRTNRLHKLLQNSDMDIENIDSLREQMASLDEIKTKYTISNITKVECEGCIYNYPGQIEHMTCPTGCLHDHSLCEQ